MIISQQFSNHAIIIKIQFELINFVKRSTLDVSLTIAELIIRLNAIIEYPKL
jgi:hypothetical protein